MCNHAWTSPSLNTCILVKLLQKGSAEVLRLCWCSKPEEQQFQNKLLKVARERSKKQMLTTSNMEYIKTYDGFQVEFTQKRFRFCVQRRIPYNS